MSTALNRREFVQAAAAVAAEVAPSGGTVGRESAVLAVA